MLLGFIAAFTTLFSWSFGTLVFFRASRSIDPGLLNRTRLLLAVGATAVLCCVIQGWWPWYIVTRSSLDQWIWLGLSGVIGLTIGDHLGFTSLRILGARRQSIIGTIAPAAAAVVGFVVLSETLTVMDIIGMVLSIGGVMYAMNSTQERHEVQTEGFGSFTLGIVLALGGAVCQGAGLVVAKIGLQSGSGDITPFHATFMRMSVGFVGTYVFDILRRAPHRPLREAFVDRPAARAMYLGVLFGPIIGVTCSLIAARNLNVAIAQTIMSMVPFVVIASAAITQRTALPWRSVVGAVLAVTGVVLLAL